MDIRQLLVQNKFTDITDNSVVGKYFELEEVFSKIEDYIKNVDNSDLLTIRQYIKELNIEFSQYRLFLCSFLLNLSNEPNDAELLLELANEPGINVYNKFFISYQLLRLKFLYPGRFDSICDLQLYNEFYDFYARRFGETIHKLPKAAAQKDRVLVLTSQFLGERHAPTRTTLERCETIIKDMNKQVLCINTREMYNELGFIPCYKFTLGELDTSYNGMSEIDFKGTTVSLYQPEYNPLVPANLTKLLELIYEYAPERIVVIGNRSIIGDFCAEIVPTVCIPLVFSEINKKKNQYVFTAGPYTGDLPWVIKGTFTFSLNSQKVELTRQQLGIPEDRFILVVVGIRLDYDVNSEFIESIKKTFKAGTFIVFAGCFDRYKELAKKDSVLQNNSAYLGYQNDILALMECCDLYVNPYRLGGGFSVAEAFCKGVPGVTIAYGDVAAAAGTDFCVNNYEEMISTIMEYKNNKAFYKSMSEKASKRYVELTDSNSALKYVFDEMDKRNLFE